MEILSSHTTLQMIWKFFPLIRKWFPNIKIISYNLLKDKFIKELVDYIN